MTSVPLTTRVEFIVELAKRLHEYGTAAPRLEAAISLVAQRLSLSCDILSTPTSIIMSFSQFDNSESGVAELTQVLRLPPGEINLKHLCLVDEIADQVINGVMDLAEGRRRLRDIAALKPSLAFKLLTLLAYAIAPACVAAILLTGWAGVATAAVIGFVTGLTALSARKRPNIAAAFEAISALLATIIATVVAVYLVPIQVRSVVVASLIILLPGMSLTAAVRELSNQDLVSGTARMAGAMAVLLKLAFGTVAATQICALFGLVPPPVPLLAIPAWTEWVAVPLSAITFAITFRSPLRYFPIVIGAVIAGYICTRVGGVYVSAAFGVFAGGLLLGASSNVFARVFNRPGALIREPGIILLVPGSVGFRTLSFVFERDVMLGLDTGITLMTLLVALVAGLLFGDLLVPPRRKL
ncbi:threonine/serine ThrE exporter family protein [Dokdonella sp.]|uniref:threonine/serine ThrE exporter family protein n=1 Tax=Dokdonella sp. TaxID=2291710 RepID=UPI003C6735F8